MFCPECEAEYRPGFTRCSDCGVDLVDQLAALPVDAVSGQTDSGLVAAWVGQSQELCVMYCQELRDAGIPYQVLQKYRQVFKDVDGNYTIGVSAELLDQAKKIIEQGADNIPSNPAEEAAVELPAQDDKLPMDVDDEHVDWKDEAPDDARVEVASDPTRDGADMIVLALRENDIESRIAIQADGSRKIFVTPHDEVRAREIVREIESETPPE
jgi:hypothetical protein